MTSSDRRDVTRGNRRLEVVVDSSTTDGSYGLIEATVPAGASGPPLHVHPSSDETFVVLSGTLLLHLDGQVLRVPAGQIAHVPRGSTHTFAGTPDESVTFVTVHVPGGFEHFHVEASAAADAAGRELSPGELVEIARRFDWRPAGPPMLATGGLAGTATEA